MHNLPSSWQVKSLGEVTKLIRGVNYDNTQVSKIPIESYVPLFRANNINDGLLFDDLVYVPSFLVKEEQFIKRGDILIAMSSGSKDIVGKTTQAKSNLEFSFGAFCALLRSNELVESKYLGYYFRTKNYRTYISHSARGANINNLRKESFERIQIPLPPLLIQKQIAEILEKADQAKQKRKDANRLTDEFLQSVFIEMFGDPVKNPKGWEVVELKALAKIERDSITSENLSKDDLYIGLEHIEKETGRLLGFQRVGDIDLKSNKFMFTAKHILYGKLRPYLNKAYLPNFSGVCSTDIIPIRPKENICDKYFLAYLFKQSFFVQEATSKSTGANLPRISPIIIGTFKIIGPPLSLQQQFADIVNKTETLKEKQKQSEQELENLFQSLMQRAFKGKLI